MRTLLYVFSLTALALSVAPGLAATSYPLVLQNCDTVVALAAAPERVVTIKSSVTECCWRLGWATESSASDFRTARRRRRGRRHRLCRADHSACGAAGDRFAAPGPAAGGDADGRQLYGLDRYGGAQPVLAA